MEHPGKKVLRDRMRAARAALGRVKKELHDIVICGVLTLRSPRAKGPVAVYLATPDEIDLSLFIRVMLKEGRLLAAPRWNGTTYTLARLNGLDAASLRKGPMGVLEPADDDPVDPGDIALWVVPGLAFGRDGRRLGYGGGWYDRLLAAAAPDAARWGVAYSFQLTDEVPSEPHDIPLTDVVTEESE